MVKDAMRLSVNDATEIKNLISDALTDDIESHELFMKGIDYSYYYEEVTYTRKSCHYGNKERSDNEAQDKDRTCVQ